MTVFTAKWWKTSSIVALIGVLLLNIPLINLIPLAIMQAITRGLLGRNNILMVSGKVTDYPTLLGYIVLILAEIIFFYAGCAVIRLLYGIRNKAKQ